MDADIAAARHIGAIIGIALQWLLDPDAFDLEAAAADAEDALIAAVSRELAPAAAGSRA